MVRQLRSGDSQNRHLTLHQSTNISFNRIILLSHRLFHLTAKWRCQENVKLSLRTPSHGKTWRYSYTHF